MVHVTTAPTVITGCPVQADPCLSNLTIYCHNGGICCHIKTMPNEMFCACPVGYMGTRCAEKFDVNEFLESRMDAMKMISLSAGISIAVGLIALLALSTIVFIIVRNARRRRRWSPVDGGCEPDIDKTIIYIQDEIAKLSTVQQLSKLQRLSKLFEKTVREAILSDPGNQMPRPSSTVMNEYLPRWSSAPSCFNRPLADVDMTDAPGGPDEVFVKTRLQQVFSLQ